jgi:hypothetical protein
MSNVTHNPQSLKDFMIGMAGALWAAAAWAYSHAAYIIGLLVAIYGLYNQHLLAKINREKLKNLNKGTHEED